MPTVFLTPLTSSSPLLYFRASSTFTQNGVNDTERFGGERWWSFRLIVILHVSYNWRPGVVWQGYMRAEYPWCTSWTRPWSKPSLLRRATLSSSTERWDGNIWFEGGDKETTSFLILTCACVRVCLCVFRVSVQMASYPRDYPFWKRTTGRGFTRSCLQHSQVVEWKTFVKTENLRCLHMSYSSIPLCLFHIWADVFNNVAALKHPDGKYSRARG